MIACLCYFKFLSLDALSLWVLPSHWRNPVTEEEHHRLVKGEFNTQNSILTRKSPTFGCKVCTASIKCDSTNAIRVDQVMRVTAKWVQILSIFGLDRKNGINRLAGPDSLRHLSNAFTSLYLSASSKVVCVEHTRSHDSLAMDRTHI